eukprot:764195-Hanusia_phi.AAC.1
MAYRNLRMLGRSFFLRPFYARTISSLSSSKEATHTCNPRWLVAFCFSATGDGFDFHGAAYALNHAFGGIPKLFFSEVAHIAVFLHKGKRIPVSHHEASPTNDMVRVVLCKRNDGALMKSPTEGSERHFHFQRWFDGSTATFVLLRSDLLPARCFGASLRSTRARFSLSFSHSATHEVMKLCYPPSAALGPSREELKWCFGKKFGYDKGSSTHWHATAEQARVPTASDVLVLSNPDVASNETKTMQQNTLEKRSVKMDRLEIYMNSLVRSLKAMPQDIILDVVPHSESGHKYGERSFVAEGWTRTERAASRVLQKMGEILYLRDVLNLRGCLDTPKAYWNKPGIPDDLMIWSDDNIRRIGRNADIVHYSANLCLDRVQLQERLKEAACSSQPDRSARDRGGKRQESGIARLTGKRKPRAGPIDDKSAGTFEIKRRVEPNQRNH